MLFFPTDLHCLWGLEDMTGIMTCASTDKGLQQM